MIFLVILYLENLIIKLFLILEFNLELLLILN